MPEIRTSSGQEEIGVAGSRLREGQAAAPSLMEAEGAPLLERLLGAGVDRRAFLSYCAGITVALALPPRFAPRVAEALAKVDRPSLVWLEFQDCAGNTESFLRSRNPSVAELVLGMLSIDYQETIMAAAGHDAEAALDSTVAKGGHLVVVEGSVPTGDGGVYCTIGGKTAQQRLKEATKGAAAVVNVGTCSSFGGIPAAAPNPTGAVGVPDLVSGVPVLNLPGCPVNADNLTATLAHYLTFGELQAAEHLPQLPVGAMERVDQLADRRRPPVRGLLRAVLLGHDDALLRAAAQAARARGRDVRRARRAHNRGRDGRGLRRPRGRQGDPAPGGSQS